MRVRARARARARAEDDTPAESLGAPRTRRGVLRNRKPNRKRARKRDPRDFRLSA